MFYALDHALSLAEQVILIGTDCPMINEQFLELAFSSLDADHDLVLGPAQDGGYVLIGANRISSTVFQNIRWSTSCVLEQTLQNIEHIGWKHHLLPTLRDIDTYQDLSELSQSNDFGILNKKYLVGPSVD